jgi:transposase
MVPRTADILFGEAAEPAIPFTSLRRLMSVGMGVPLFISRRKCSMTPAKTQFVARPFDEGMPVINPRAAGIDIGSRSHDVSVPDDRPGEPAVREFGAFTPDLCALAEWLTARGVITVAMEATGVYWIPLYQLLCTRGFTVIVANPHTAKNVPGRKTDVADCQWLRKLHTFGLLEASFCLPIAQGVLRDYWRLRTARIHDAADEIRHIQKAMDQMNVHLHHAVTDIMGVSGLKIVRAIAAGHTDPAALVLLIETRLKCSTADLLKALTGQYLPQHIFALKQALERYDFLATQIAACDAQVEATLQALAVHEAPPTPPHRQSKSKGEPAFNLQGALTQVCGVDLTAIAGLGSMHTLTIISEVGTDLTPWPSEKHFASWLALSPANKITGNKSKSSRTRKVVNRAAEALRMAAFSLSHSHSALGAFYRRMRAKLGAPKAITAVAHKLAVLVYRLLRHGSEYVEIGEVVYEQRYQERRLKALQRNANALGFELVPRSI